MNDDSSEDSASSTTGGLAAFIVRILEQLSLSAWLPAGLLSASVTLLVCFRQERSINLVAAIGRITDNPWGIVLLAVPLLLVATMITQAFSYIAIRVLEGYWSRGGLVSVCRSLLIRCQLRRRSTLMKQRKKAVENAFGLARPKMLEAGWTRLVVMRFEQIALGIDPDATGERSIEEDQLSDEELRILKHASWRTFCEPWRLARIDSLGNEYLRYPEPLRMMPTRLGNVLRASEDTLEMTEGNLQSFVMRNKQLLPLRLQHDHDHYRTRLDMYAMFVFIGAFLAVLSPLMLAGKVCDSWAIATISGFFIALCIAGYQAAIASAEAYCGILKELDRIVKSS
ncbi:hypothetical protein [Arthrobacter antibioticus]|uniref:hypothetical protein n=1 Tax=Arthrobacter sp. H35-MC1 TaxID=3046203 RepID=UPI0024B9935D|nr:hypothetical protein [Arthrobacter sp. H35-MC1]MDJ0318399.1 hypothetical protein [Arthrobacter sp. H35-MC1]